VFFDTVIIENFITTSECYYLR